MQRANLLAARSKEKHALQQKEQAVQCTGYMLFAEENQKSYCSISRRDLTLIRPTELVHHIIWRWLFIYAAFPSVGELNVASVCLTVFIRVCVKAMCVLRDFRL